MQIERFKPTKETTAHRINVMRGKTRIATGLHPYTSEGSARRAVKNISSGIDAKVKSVKEKTGWAAQIFTSRGRPIFKLEKIFKTEKAATKAGENFLAKFH